MNDNDDDEISLREMAVTIEGLRAMEEARKLRERQRWEQIRGKLRELLAVVESNI